MDYYCIKCNVKRQKAPPVCHETGGEHEWEEDKKVIVVTITPPAKTISNFEKVQDAMFIVTDWIQECELHDEQALLNRLEEILQMAEDT